jgi:very-short-patch-repair endonuclease
MPAKRDDIDADHLVEDYLGGDSQRVLAARYLCSQATVGRVLAEAGVALRSRSAAGLLRASRASDEQRAIWRDRFEPIRRKSTTPTALARRAVARQTVEGQIGRFERETEEALARCGFEPRRQVAVGKYNVDLAVNQLAVEIHTNAHGPRTGSRIGTIQSRVDYLTDQGWTVLYVWCPYGINPGDARNVIARVDELRGSPAVPGEYRVLRCHGYPPALGRPQHNYLPLMPTASGMGRVRGNDRVVAGQA